jgi:ribosomal protein S27AE
MTIATRTTTHAVCPTCGELVGQIDHLLSSRVETRWYCKRCGQQYGLRSDGDGHVDITPRRERCVTTYDVLVLPPQEQPVYFVVKGMRFDRLDCKETPEEAREHAEFYYEEHSCPTNWLRPEMVYIDGDADPHGLIKFVRRVDASSIPPDEPTGPNAHDAALRQIIEGVAKRQ